MMLSRTGRICHVKFVQFQRILTPERKDLGVNLTNYALNLSILISIIVIK